MKRIIFLFFLLLITLTSFSQSWRTSDGTVQHWTDLFSPITWPVTSHITCLDSNKDYVLDTIGLPQRSLFNTLNHVFVENGVIGATGATGSTGATGNNGINGKNGPTGPTGADGSLNAWGLTGNTGTNSGTNYIGTTDNNSVVFKSNATKMFELDSMGNISGWEIQYCLIAITLLNLVQTFLPVNLEL